MPLLQMSQVASNKFLKTYPEAYLLLAYLVFGDIPSNNNFIIQKCVSDFKPATGLGMQRQMFIKIMIFSFLDKIKSICL